MLLHADLAPCCYSSMLLHAALAPRCSMLLHAAPCCSMLLQTLDFAALCRRSPSASGTLRHRFVWEDDRRFGDSLGLLVADRRAWIGQKQTTQDFRQVFRSQDPWQRINVSDAFASCSQTPSPEESSRSSPNQALQAPRCASHACSTCA